MSDIINVSLSRRRFLELGAASAGVFILGMSLPLSHRFVNAAEHKSGAGELNAFIAIKSDGSVIFQNPFIEMGQGTYTSIPAIMAEELDAAMDRITIEQAPHGPEYKIMFGPNSRRFTGGSYSVRSSYDTMRKAGATARAMLIEAAAKEWNVPAEECRTEPGVVIHTASGRRLHYGELAAMAATLEPPGQVPLKDKSEFRLIGQPVKRTDSLAKATGQATFGIDIQVDGMKNAAVKQSPVFGGQVKSFDSAAVMDMKGVMAVEEIPNGIAVIATHFWQAKKALDKLPVEFDNADHEEFSDESYLKKLQARVDEPGGNAENIGDALSALKSADRVLEAEYHWWRLIGVSSGPLTRASISWPRRLPKSPVCRWRPSRSIHPIWVVVLADALSWTM